ncbi:hypothetical protein BBJ28_00018396 [Nothophytophthora sp. Chile5]|nr:hypothetical protein BBJ28_00018396 [Nothophytophthora sp. Chile5]
MRVKKLNVNRRHKPGEDEAAIGIAAGGDNEQRRWVSPTKPALGDFGSAAVTTISSGASSPTDPSSVHPVQSAALRHQQQHQHSGENSPSRFQTNSSGLFARGSFGAGGVVPSSTAKNSGLPVIMANRGGDSASSRSNADASQMEDWQDVVDRSVREAVHAKIVEILRALKPNAPEKVLERLPGLAYRMEEALFKMATSEAEYSDAATLAQRLTRIQESNAKRLLTQQSPTVVQDNSSNATPHGSNGSTQTRKPLTEEQVRVVFQHLQTWRQKLVNMYGVAPWEILPNQTLAKVAVYVPSTEQELAVCGVHEEQIARFGSSLVQELQRMCGAYGSKPARKPLKSTAAKQTRKSEGKRSAADGLATGSHKKRKNGELPTATRLAPAAPAFAGSSLMSPSQLLFRPPGMDALPTLLPSASMTSGGATATTSSSSSSATGKKSPFAPAAAVSRLSPVAQVIQQPFFSRLQPQQQVAAEASSSSSSPSTQENHMHLLAQGAGQMSKQPDAKSVELYEQEVQSLRWMLHQSQQEKTQLESELQRLRAQLQGATATNVLDVHRQRHVAIKCIRQQELNVLGEREAAVLRQVNARDGGAACAVVRLLETFMENGHFCLVLELLGCPVVDVAVWGPWRQAPPDGAPNRTHKLFTQLALRRSRVPLVASPSSCSTPDTSIQSLDGPPTQGSGDQKAEEAGERPVTAPPLSLMDVREMAVHLCGALAFLHDQGLIHADVKPENVVRSSAEASLSSSSCSSSCGSPVKLVDFGNCLDANELAAYAEEEPKDGFDVQTVTYRAPEVAAGLLLSPAMDVWSLGCLLLECASGRPLFTLPSPPVESSVQTVAAVTRHENSQLLRQVEHAVADGAALGVVCPPYKVAACYASKAIATMKSESLQEQEEPSMCLRARLEAAAPGNHQFHDFIYRLLDVNPATRLTAKRALLHPFLQAYFPFGTVFAPPIARRAGSGGKKRGVIVDVAPSVAAPNEKRKAPQYEDHEGEGEGMGAKKRPRVETTASTRGKDLRAALKLIPRGVSKRSSLSPP